MKFLLKTVNLIHRFHLKLPLHQKSVFWYSFSQLTLYFYVLKLLMLMWNCLNCF